MRPLIIYEKKLQTNPMAKVKEGHVLQILCKNLDQKGWNYLVHIPGSHRHRNEYRPVVENNRIEAVPIGNDRPDILGFNSAGEVCAIEAKGSTGHSDALGSALNFRKGVHKSYIAAPPQNIEKIKESPHAGEIGLIEVEQDNINWNHPSIGENRTLLPDIRAQLKYRLENWTTMGSISSQRLSQPVNFLAPIFTLDENSQSKYRLADELRKSYDVNDTDAMYYGALSLGLIQNDDCEKTKLTDNSLLAISTLKGKDINSLSDLMDLKKRTSNSRCLYTEQPTVATLLRKQYREHPEFRHLHTIIEEFDDRKLPIPKVTRSLSREYPNSFVNIFVAEPYQAKARRIIEKKGADELHTDLDTWRDLILQNVYDNFTRQLRQIGILSTRTEVYNGKKRRLLHNSAKHVDDEAVKKAM